MDLRKARKSLSRKLCEAREAQLRVARTAEDAYEVVGGPRAQWQRVPSEGPAMQFQVGTVAVRGFRDRVLEQRHGEGATANAMLRCPTLQDAHLHTSGGPLSLTLLPARERLPKQRLAAPLCMERTTHVRTLLKRSTVVSPQRRRSR